MAGGKRWIPSQWLRGVTFGATAVPLGTRLVQIDSGSVSDSESRR